MAENRVDELAARKQPVPRPLPPGGVDVLDVGPERKPAHRRPQPHRRSRRRRIARALRSRRGRWVLIVLACLAVLLIGLLAQGFLSSPAPSVGPPDSAGGTTVPSVTSQPSVKPSAVKSPPRGGPSQLVGDAVGQLRAHFPDNPLNHIDTSQLHNVTVEASAPGPIAVAGYLVPTGLGAAYANVPKGQHSFRVTQQALGGGYLAAIFIQTGKSGIPVTCQVTVDGKVKSTQTTSGSYGRALCLG